jgi:predicted MFS family arabinose efflux permease
MAFAGAGAVVGALIVAWLGKYPKMGRTLLLLQVAYGILVALFASTRLMWLNELLLFASLICGVIVSSTLLSLVQMNAPNEMRGRVMSIFMVAFRGGMPLGSLALGSLASATSAPAALTVCGIGLVGVSVLFLIRGTGVKHL